MLSLLSQIVGIFFVMFRLLANVGENLNKLINMIVSISNKTLKVKPAKEQMGRFFGKKGTPNRIQFLTGNYEIEDFEKIISSGYTLSYQYKNDDVMGDRKKNYIGTDFIIIDIDGTDLTMDEVIERATYKPSIIHTTFSNLTERKNNKHCYHLIYCLDETLYGEENFNDAFNYFSCGIEDLIDQNARDCHRLTFTSNSSLPNYEYRLLGISYSSLSISNLHRDDSLDDKSNVDVSSVKKNNSSPIFNSLDNMRVKEKNLTELDNSFELDEGFLKDLNSMTRRKFIDHYSSIYDYITFTPPKIIEKTPEGIVYADYRSQQYFEIPSLWRTNQDGSRERQKIEVGNRTTHLYIETNLFILIKPDISKEHLVYEVVRDIFENYDNTDNQFSTRCILSLVENVWKNKDSFNAHPIPRKFKILRFAEGISKQVCVGMVRKYMKDDSIGSLLDLNLSVEENLFELRKMGVKVKKKRLIQFIQDNHLDEYVWTEKQKREEKVRTIVKNNPNASLRVLSSLCKEHGIKVSREKIRKIKLDDLACSLQGKQAGQIPTT